VSGEFALKVGSGGRIVSGGSGRQSAPAGYGNTRHGERGTEDEGRGGHETGDTGNGGRGATGEGEIRDQRDGAWAAGGILSAWRRSRGRWGLAFI
jgi:hypothetical protein